MLRRRTFTELLIDCEEDRTLPGQRHRGLWWNLNVASISGASRQNPHPRRPRWFPGNEVVDP